MLDPADKALIKELEYIIISKSIKYVRIEDEALTQKGSTSPVKDIKKAIKSIELPMVEFPIDTIKDIFDVIVVVDPENYVLVINASGEKLDNEALKKVTANKPLLESICKSNLRMCHL